MKGRIGMDRAAKKHLFDRDDARDAVIDECASKIPTTWLDPLLSGPNKVGDMPGRETEALLRGIQDRIRALKSKR